MTDQCERELRFLEILGPSWMEKCPCFEKLIITYETEKMEKKKEGIKADAGEKRMEIYERRKVKQSHYTLRRCLRGEL
jgi:hypothetical protein